MNLDGSGNDSRCHTTNDSVSISSEVVIPLNEVGSRRLKFRSMPFTH